MKNKLNILSHPVTLVLILVLMTTLAWVLRFIQDDAFISFRYAENLCNGDGLVFNVGERVEGYTNFLWTVFMAVGMKMGLDPVIFSQMVGLACYPLSLGLIYQVGLSIFDNRKAALYALLLAATNFTYVSYATGGLETHWQSFLFLLGIFLHLKQRHNPALLFYLAQSIVMGLAFLLRMDSAIFIACVLVAELWTIWELKGSHQQRLKRTAALCLPAAVIAGSWLCWKFSFYGHILPNTYAAKNPGFSALVPGFYYLALFFFSYGLFLIAAPLFTVFRKRCVVPSGLLLPLSFSILWMAYIVKVGGGFMEFRFMVPVIPFLALAIVWVVRNAFRKEAVTVGWVILFSLISLFHSSRSRLYGVEKIEGLQSHLTKGKWMAAGAMLGEKLDGDVCIATTAAGAIPFYSKLPTVDILGLNDVWVAQNGVSSSDPNRKWLGAKPGHQKKATLAYLQKRKVHLLIGHPLILNQNTAVDSLSVDKFADGSPLALSPAPFPDNACLVGLPIDEESMLVAVYLTPHPQIDKMIATGEWKNLSERVGE